MHTRRHVYNRVIQIERRIDKPSYSPLQRSTKIPKDMEDALHLKKMFTKRTANTAQFASTKSNKDESL